MRKIEIKIPAVEPGGYTITIGDGITASSLEQLQSDLAERNPFIVTDENLVSAGHLKTLLGSGDIPVYVISPAGESSKHINTVVSIVETMEQAFLGRDTVVIALGGGTVGDIAGFAASIFKRGVPVVQIPTTTVAQADSSVGGKTGVDSSISKNAFGSFWQPASVFIDVATLKTLDDRQYRAGLVESVKHAIIADADYFAFIEDNLDDLLERKSDVLEEIAFRNCRIKGQVVEADPTEKNLRRVLNYGHTVGHAVETASDFKLLHGESVAIGIIAAGLIEIEMGLGNPERLDRIRKVFEKLGLEVSLPEDIADEKLMDIIKRDKKAVNKWPKFVLIDKIGNVHCQEGQYGIDVKQSLVEKVLRNIK